MATTFGLASHSKGSKNRCALVYPRCHFKENQESEKNKKQKEFSKLKTQNKKMIAADDPKTIRDKMIALVAEEIRQNPD